jgi:hypothetical protein
VSGNNRQDKKQDTDDTNEHNNQFPKQGYNFDDIAYRISI